MSAARSFDIPGIALLSGFLFLLVWTLVLLSTTALSLAFNVTAGLLDAAKQFDDAQAKLKETRDQAIQTAKDTADASAATASKSSFAGFGVLLLDLIAAAFGGSLAVQRRLLVVRRAPVVTP